MSLSSSARWYNSETLLWNWTQTVMDTVEGLNVPGSYQVIPHSIEEGLNLVLMGGMVKNIATYALKNLRKILKMDFQGFNTFLKTHINIKR